MILDDFRPVAMDALADGPTPISVGWLWDGYLMPGDVVLLTSLWKTGKTTLVAGLLQSIGAGTPFLGRATRPGRAWVISEESRSQWQERVRMLPIGPHVHLLARPFRGRPELVEWELLINRAAEAQPDLVVVDPLASFLPGRCESDAASLLEALAPLHRLTASGAAVLLLHHPRKKAAEVGSIARGSGALLGFVDASLELTRYSSLPSDANRRLIRAQSRRAETPDRLAYEWDRATGAFVTTVDPRHRQFEENWQTVVRVLKGRAAGITIKEVAACWPDDAGKPSRSSLYAWLDLAFERKLIRRDGSGTKKYPWRYRTENEDDEYYDRGELPPIKPLGRF